MLLQDRGRPTGLFVREIGNGLEGRALRTLNFTVNPFLRFPGYHACSTADDQSRKVDPRDLNLANLYASDCTLKSQLTLGPSSDCIGRWALSSRRLRAPSPSNR
jgi:hypothetical protein